MHFNLTRFGRLFMKHTAEHYRYYLMATAVLIGVLTFLFVVLIRMEQGATEEKGQSILFVLVLFGAGTIFTSTIFSDLGDKKKAIATLTLPASHLEKYLVGWLYSFPIYLVVYLLSFWLVSHLMVPLDNWEGQEPQILNVFSGEFEMPVFYVLFGFLNAIAFWGSIFFEKWQFIKTAFIFFLAMVLLAFLNTWFMEGLLGRDLENTTPFSNIGLYENGEYYSVRFPDEQAYLLGLMLAGVTLLLWVTTYFRLREKEV